MVERDAGGHIGAIDIIDVRRNKMVRDITFDAQTEAHAQRVLERLRTLPAVKVLSASDRIFLLHLGGKISTRSKVPVRTRNTLSLAYNDTHPGQTEFVAERCGIASGMVAMMLAGPTLRTVPVTTHIALKDVPEVLTSELIATRGRTTIRGLRRQFGNMAQRLLARFAAGDRGGEQFAAESHHHPPQRPPSYPLCN